MERKYDNIEDRYIGCLVGLAVGDALGTTVEFKERGTFKPLYDIVGGGPFKLKKGMWTDDTIMALCLAESLLECNGFNPFDQMDRYLKWYNDGYMSPTGKCFDIGGTTYEALMEYQFYGKPYAGSTHPRTAGNGCIMRLAPIPMYFSDIDNVRMFSSLSASTTHGAPECLDCSALFGSLIFHALNGFSKEYLLTLFNENNSTALFKNTDFLNKTYDEIHGTGYVVQSMEAALWCFFNTKSFKDAVLNAVNLGDDADTTGAIVGQLAGAYYGFSFIPDFWSNVIYKRDFIMETAVNIFDKRNNP